MGSKYPLHSAIQPPRLGDQVTRLGQVKQSILLGKSSVRLSIATRCPCSLRRWKLFVLNSKIGCEKSLRLSERKGEEEEEKEKDCGQSD